MTDHTTRLREIESWLEQYEKRIGLPWVDRFAVSAKHADIRYLLDHVRELEAALEPFAKWDRCYCEPYWLEDYNRHGPNCHFEDFEDAIEAARVLLPAPETVEKG